MIAFSLRIEKKLNIVLFNIPIHFIPLLIPQLHQKKLYLNEAMILLEIKGFLLLKSRNSQLVASNDSLFAFYSLCDIIKMENEDLFERVMERKFRNETIF